MAFQQTVGDGSLAEFFSDDHGHDENSISGEQSRFKTDGIVVQAKRKPETKRRRMNKNQWVGKHHHADSRSLGHLPNEILIHIASFLHTNSIKSLALVSWRFYDIVVSPYPWIAAFARNFHAAIPPTPIDYSALPPHHRDWDKSTSDLFRRPTIEFGRLAAKATWHSEYENRFRLLRAISRAKPRRKASDTVTYQSMLDWNVSHIDVDFSPAETPVAVHGSVDTGGMSVSNPNTGKTRKRGMIEFTARHMDPAAHGNVHYGLGSGPTIAQNVMDISHKHGMVYGEAYPGGRLFYRPRGAAGRVLNHHWAPQIATSPIIPVVPVQDQGISSVWIAKSASVLDPAVGIMTGSTLGIVTTYSIGSRGDAFEGGSITAQWVVCAGVPIVSIKVDNEYTLERRNAGRVWAVVLNALGEVYYLCKPPVMSCLPLEMPKAAWAHGRLAPWYLIEATQRRPNPTLAARLDDPSALTENPRTSPYALGKSPDELKAEAQRITAFLSLLPSWFRERCEGWNMQRTMEVDFGADDGKFAGETVFVLDGEHRCGTSWIVRYTRPSEPSSLLPSTEAQVVVPWASDELKLKDKSRRITASALDLSTCARQTLFEAAALYNDGSSDKYGSPDLLSSIPGGRARFLAVGFDNGSIMVWNARAAIDNSRALDPIRTIQTPSPQITCLAVSSLCLVHGGSDGLAQVWDPLASIYAPIKIIHRCTSTTWFGKRIKENARFLNKEFEPTVGAIFLDPDPTSLRGVLSVGSDIRAWAFSAGALIQPPTPTPQSSSRRLHHALSQHIEIEQQQLHSQRTLYQETMDTIRRRFAHGLASQLTDEEATAYARLLSEESFAVEADARAALEAEREAERAVANTSDGTDGDATDDAPSGGSSANTTPLAHDEPLVHVEDGDVEFALQLQRAMRLSLEDDDQDIASPSGYQFSVNFKPLRRGKKSPKSVSKTSSPAVQSPTVGDMVPRRFEDLDAFPPLASGSGHGGSSGRDIGLGILGDEFPPLGVDKGKSEGRTR